MQASFLLSQPAFPSAAKTSSSHLRTPCSFPIRASTTIPPETSTPPAATTKLKKYSSRITEPKSPGGSQEILNGVGISDDDTHKLQVGISSVWYEGNTCNMHLLKLGEVVKEGVQEAGMAGLRFNTIGVSAAISVGTFMGADSILKLGI